MGRVPLSSECPRPSHVAQMTVNDFAVTELQVKVPYMSEDFCVIQLHYIYRASSPASARESLIPSSSLDSFPAARRSICSIVYTNPAYTSDPSNKAKSVI